MPQRPAASESQADRQPCDDMRASATRGRLRVQSRSTSRRQHGTHRPRADDGGCVTVGLVYIGLRTRHNIRLHGTIPADTASTAVGRRKYAITPQDAAGTSAKHDSRRSSRRTRPARCCCALLRLTGQDNLAISAPGLQFHGRQLDPDRRQSHFHLERLTAQRSAPPAGCGQSCNMTHLCRPASRWRPPVAGLPSPRRHGSSGRAMVLRGMLGNGPDDAADRPSAGDRRDRSRHAAASGRDANRSVGAHERLPRRHRPVQPGGHVHRPARQHRGDGFGGEPAGNPLQLGTKYRNDPWPKRSS